MRKESVTTIAIAKSGLKRPLDTSVEAELFPLAKTPSIEMPANSLFTEFKKNLELADRLSAQVEFLLTEVRQIVKRS